MLLVESHYTEFEALNFYVRFNFLKSQTCQTTENNIKFQRKRSTVNISNAITTGSIYKMRQKHFNLFHSDNDET